MSVQALTQLRRLLDHFDPEDRNDQLGFFRLVYLTGPEAAQELIPRLAKSITPKGLRLLITETAFYYPSTEWLEPLGRLLRHEPDLGVFRSAAWALMQAGGPEATEALRSLYATRSNPAFQEILSQALAVTDPEAAFAHHLERLLEGSAHSQVANLAASELARLMGPEVVGTIMPLVRHGDVLVARHALRLVTLVDTGEAARFLLERLLELHGEILEDRRFKDVLAEYRNIPVAGQREWALALAKKHLVGPALERLAAVESGAEGAVAELLSTAAGREAQLTASVLALVEEGKGKLIATLIKEQAEAFQWRNRFYAPMLDICAEGLGRMCKFGLIPREDLLPALTESMRHQTGREGLARSLATLVHPEEPILDTLLECGDPVLRGTALDTLGTRAEAAFLPFFLKACRDPITDLADRALVYAGMLPGAEAAMAQHLAQQDPAAIQLGIRLAGMNRMAAAVSHLETFVETCDREALVCEAYEALGDIGSDQAARILLARLHSGQSARCQVALASALKECALPGIAEALAEKARSLQNPEVHVLATEALLTAHDGLDTPLLGSAMDLLRAQIQGCWDAVNPWPGRLRIVQALGGLRCESPEHLAEMAALVGSLLADKRNKSAWTAEQQAMAQGIVKLLEKRAEAMKG